ncbi:tRNA preQ1(34) S-adenosylmethionine ribosyltransferase-isomerase QueA [Alkalicoccus luteus]|uniref:S-adenosylmethionine:tRNA ribosyltransferase-isomerase n=1 Tax=Alkalicoccus luteus TaxID=1237094 RepID=A0A969PS75_9BACI|nr:tRNA preQ1(34) S-adenosylmethionine ribosyltransferase-isomerase QueA [Alkalicoccus luteus]NJP36574.1 tRNA preQ1(34) S-adenosylmethionine ribosyltransferase-isomerase QueA [Alkalicoccus luteus]
MDVNQFDYELPEDLIAQTPLKDREQSRMLVMDKDNGTIVHRHFYDLPEWLEAGDTLVLNDTKVIPARLLGSRKDTGGKVEMLLLHEKEDFIWEVLVKPARRIREGAVLTFGDGLLEAVCLEELPEGRRKMKLEFSGIFPEILDQLGEMPLPPYIQEQLKEKERYQTVYAENSGSAAAPTAGLHFTPAMLNRVREAGVDVVTLTLHVGLGTFRPVAVDSVEEHSMHAEYYELSESAAEKLNRAKQEGRRIIAVGTTSARTLETVARDTNGEFCEASGWTDIFIYPGFTFRAVDALLTNFHLPKSTLVMLVSAFAGREHILNAYETAVRHQYRFFSFGDAMLLTDTERNR